MMTVTIEGVEYPVYADIETADEYLVASMSAAIWRTEIDLDLRGRALITATRLMDRQKWLDAYSTIATREGEQKIIDACCEIASALLQGSDMESEASTTQKLQSIRAGSVSLTYFREDLGQAKRFPTIVWELLRDYLVGSSNLGYGKSFGTGGVSSTSDDFGVTGP